MVDTCWFVSQRQGKSACNRMGTISRLWPKEGFDLMWRPRQEPHESEPVGPGLLHARLMNCRIWVWYGRCCFHVLTSMELKCFDICFSHCYMPRSWSACLSIIIIIINLSIHLSTINNNLNLCICQSINNQ